MVCVALAAASCGGRRGAPPAPEATPVAPDLSGRTVMLLPVQPGAVPSAAATTPQNAVRFDGVDALDAELAYWLRELAPRTKWVMPDVLRRTLARSPGLAIDLNALQVSSFRVAQVRRIGDPLYGDLRRLAAIHDAQFALVPVAAEYRPVGADSGRVDVAAALIDIHFGDVLWFGTAAGEPGTTVTQLAASTAQRLAGQFAHLQRGRTGVMR